MTNWEEIKQRVANGDELAFYSTSAWQTKRKQIKQRDHGLCQRCLNRWQGTGHIRYSRAEVVHHIIPMKQDFGKALIDSNLISLCFWCHEEIEGRTNSPNFKKTKKLTDEKW